MAQPDKLPRRLLSVRDACRRHRQLTDRDREIHRSAIYRLLKAGKIRGERRAGRVLVDLASLEDYCAPVPIEASAPIRSSTTTEVTVYVRR